MKIQLSPILICIVVVILLRCAKERSCEGIDCKERDTLVIIDTIPPDTIISNMVAHYSVYISDNSKVKVIYPQYNSKYHPDTYRIMSDLKILMDTTKSSTYSGSINLRDYLPSNHVYVKGDSFLFRMQVRFNNADLFYEDSTILIYWKKSREEQQNPTANRITIKPWKRINEFKLFCSIFFGFVVWSIHVFFQFFRCTIPISYPIFYVFGISLQ